MDAVDKVAESFPVVSRDGTVGTTHHKAYLAQLFALFDALWGAADKAYDFIAVLEVCRSAVHNLNPVLNKSSSVLGYIQSDCCIWIIKTITVGGFSPGSVLACTEAGGAASGDGH